MTRTRWRAIGTLVILALLFIVGAYYQSGTAITGGAAASATRSPAAAARDSRIPQEALATLQFAKENNWKSRQGYVGDRVFENREGLLPKGGAYREYDIHPTRPGVNRGPERVVIDTRSGKAWYTGTHYGDAGEPAFIEIPAN